MGSTVEYRFIDNGTKFLKIATIVLVFVVVLGSAVVSKGVLLFMTSQVKQNVTRQYCNKYLGKEFGFLEKWFTIFCLDAARQYEFVMPNIERATWIWLISFAYFVPEAATLFR